MIQKSVPKVAVLLATYNGARFVSEQLESLSSQEGVSLSVVWGDDKSRDKTRELVEQHFEKSPEILLATHRESNEGGASGNFFNLIIHGKIDSADYVAFCDQDDFWAPSKLISAIRELGNSGGDFYSSGSVAFWPNGKERSIRKNHPEREFDYVFESASHGCTYVMRRDALERFREFLSENSSKLSGVKFHDWLLYAWARDRGYKWVHSSDQLIRYRQSDANVIGANGGVMAVRKRISLIRSGWLRSESSKILDVISSDNEDLKDVWHSLKGDFTINKRLFLLRHIFKFRRRRLHALALGFLLLLSEA